MSGLDFLREYGFWHTENNNLRVRIALLVQDHFESTVIICQTTDSISFARGTGDMSGHITLTSPERLQSLQIQNVSAIRYLKLIIRRTPNSQGQMTSHISIPGCVQEREWDKKYTKVITKGAPHHAFSHVSISVANNGNL